MLNPKTVEWTSLVLFVPLILFGLIRRKRRPSAVRRAFVRFAARRRLAVLSIGIAALLLRAALLPLHPPPQPAVVDEYSYLLAADTFASGRMANPTHPCWIHFETICEMMQPSYASKYPPGQGLVLAAGILLAGSPWVGVWLSVATMCASIVWMLQGWVRPRWALLGGILVLLRIALGSYWIDSYWGGAVAATGGAILYGALPRFLSRPRPLYGLLLGVGLAILANSRLYEGFLLSLPAMFALGVWAFRRGWTGARELVPMLGLLAVTAAGMLAYNRAVTGTPWQLPYQAHEAQYAIAPMFWFQKLRPAPPYHHDALRGFWTEWAVMEYLKTYRIGLLAAAWSKFANAGAFFLGPLLSIPLIALPWVCRQKRFQLVVIVLAFFSLGLLAIIDVLPHYAAPATALIYLTVIQCLRCLRASGPVGMVVGRGIPVVLACTVVLFYSLEASGSQFLHDQYSWCFAAPGNLQRARLLRQLEASPGLHLVIVRYGRQHWFTREWVYNRASIDTAKVVWARDMNVAGNRTLLEYFSKRHVWLLEADEPNPVLKTYREDGTL